MQLTFDNYLAFYVDLSIEEYTYQRIQVPSFKFNEQASWLIYQIMLVGFHLGEVTGREIHSYHAAEGGSRGVAPGTRRSCQGTVRPLWAPSNSSAWDTLIPSYCQLSTNTCSVKTVHFFICKARNKPNYFSRSNCHNKFFLPKSKSWHSPTC